MSIKREVKRDSHKLQTELNPGMLEWLLPAWFVNQSDPCHPAYIQDKLDFYNLSCRNWTNLKAGPNNLLLDRQGSCYLPDWRISIEFWVDTGLGLFTPGMFSQVTQHYLQDSAGIVTTSRFDGGSLEVLTSQGAEITRGLFQLEINLSNQPGVDLQNWALLLVIRPYGPDGIARIKRLEYQDRMLLAESRCLLKFETEPSHSFFSDSIIGEPYQYFRQGEGNNLVNSKDGSGTALLGFSGLAGELTGVRLLIGSRLTDPYRLIQLFKTRCIKANQGLSERGLGAVVKVEATVAEFLRVAQRHLEVFCGKQPTGVDSFQLLALNRWGYYGLARTYLEESLRRINWDGVGRRGWLGDARLIWGLVDYLRYSGDLSFGAKVWPVVKWVGFWLERRQNEASLATRKLDKEEGYFEAAFWNCAALKSLGYLGRSLVKDDQAQIFEEGYQRHWARLLEQLAKATRGDQERVIPWQLSGGKGGHLVKNLIAFYPLQLFGAQECYIQNTLDLILGKYCSKGGVVAPFRFKGIDLELTARLAQILVQTGKDYRLCWELLLESAGSTWSWPDRISPHSGLGIGKNGHDPGVLYQVLVLMHNIMVVESGDVLELVARSLGK